MRTVTYRDLPFELSEASADPAYFVLSVRKSGSSILTSMVSVLAKAHGLPFVDVTSRLFAAGVLPNDWRGDPDVARLFGGGNVYGGFRDYPEAVAGLPVFTSARKVLLVRDPRDALMSEYFSSAYSHPIPQEGSARDDLLALRTRALANSPEAYVLRRSGAMGRTMMEYAPLLQDPLLKLFRYEDVIMHKRKLLEDLSRHFGWEVRSRLIDAILQWADVFPHAERPTEFIRRVHPGDHREKLSPAAIARLDVLLAAPLQAFGYA